MNCYRSRTTCICVMDKGLQTPSNLLGFYNVGWFPIPIPYNGKALLKTAFRWVELPYVCCKVRLCEQGSHVLLSDKKWKTGFNATCISLRDIQLILYYITPCPASCMNVLEISTQIYSIHWVLDHCGLYFKL